MNTNFEKFGLSNEQFQELNHEQLNQLDFACENSGQEELREIIWQRQEQLLDPLYRLIKNYQIH